MEKGKKLYFIAIVPPPEIRSEVTGFKEHFKYQYQAKHALKSPPHITLVPPFQWDSQNTRPLFQSLEQFAAGRKTFHIELDNFGAFPPRVIFVAVKNNENLNHLFGDLMDYLDNKWRFNELIRSSNRFNPHMSVAFRDLKRENFKKAWIDFREKQFHSEFPVYKITLLEHNGRIWKIMHDFFFTKKST